MLEAGVHYGHQCRRWNPRMRPYIFGARNGVHIIDLQKTVQCLKSAYLFVENTVANGGHILFVGTKRQARDVVASEAARANMFHVNYRWLGGTLTNHTTVRQSIHRLKRLEKMTTDGTYDKLTKKEKLTLDRQREKLDLNLGGIKDMPGQPQAVFVSDAHRDKIAIAEARKLRIPIIAIADTNANPEGINFPIPGNDDSLKSLTLFIKVMAEACLSGKVRRQTNAKNSEDVTGTTKEGTIYDQEGHSVRVVKKKTN